MSRVSLRPALRQYAHRAVVAAAGVSDLYASLVAFWRLDEASGNRADSIGTNTAVDTNTVTSTTGLVYATAAQFTATNFEMLAAADSAAVSVDGDIIWWVGAWFNPTGITSSQGIVGKLPQSSPTQSTSEFSLYLDTSTLNGLMGSSAGVWTNPTRPGVAASVWHFALLWHDPTANTLNLQLDNGTVGSAATAGRVAPATAQDLRIGSHASGYMTGRIGPAMLGKGRIPTADERTWLYNAGAGRTLAEMAAYTP